MRRGVLAGLAVIAGLAQISWLPFVRPLGVVPSVVLVLVVLAAIEGQALTGLVLALVLGFMMDMVSGGLFGLWMGVLVLEVLVAALVRQAGIEVSGWLVPAIMVLAGTVLFAALVLSGLAGVTSTWPVGQLLSRLVAESLLNLMMMVLLRPLVRRVATAETGMAHG